MVTTVWTENEFERVSLLGGGDLYWFVTQNDKHIMTQSDISDLYLSLKDIFEKTPVPEKPKSKIEFKDNVMPYLPTKISGYVFADSHGELWCFSRDEDRVFHIGAELEMITNQKEWGTDFTNGFYAHNLKMAFEEVSKNVGD